MSSRLPNDIIFEEAIRKETPEARSEYLDEVLRGNDSLRLRIGKLVEAHFRAASFLETPVSGAESLAELASEYLESRESQQGEDRSLVLPGDLLSPSEWKNSLGKLGGLEVLEVFARGGMGIVLRAFDEKLQREVAVKLLAPEIAANAASRRRFVREARGAASVQHENVIAIHAVDDSGKLPFIVMPFVEGDSLQERIRREGPQPIEFVLRIAAQIAAGLAAVHARGLVHRDLKPANILIENHAEQVKITDFGVARAVDDPHATQQGLITGTPAYMSPEQAGGESVDHRGDLFSLGSVIYAMCAGGPPFEGTSIVGVIRQVCDRSPKPLYEVNKAVPRELSDFVARLHARRPADRPQTAREVEAELKAIHHRIRHPEDPQARSHSKLRIKTAAAAAIVIALALGGAEATGVTDFRGTVVRLLLPEGTLVVEVDDPSVKVTLEGTDVVITGAGAQEIRLKPGSYQLSASRDGKVVRQELVSVSRNGRQLVRIDKESSRRLIDATDAWENRVSRLSPEEQVAAVVNRLQELNPGYDGKYKWTEKDDSVSTFDIVSDDVSDLSPLKVFKKLASLGCLGTEAGRGKVKDIRPLQGLPLEFLMMANQAVSDLEPVRGMPLRVLILSDCPVEDLSPVKGMAIRTLLIQSTKIKTLEPLRGMPLNWLDLFSARSIHDLTPIEGAPLDYLNVSYLSLEPGSWNVIASMKKLEMLILTGTQAKDLSFLRSHKLKQIALDSTQVEDISPLSGMPLSRIVLDYRQEWEKILRSFPKLELINLKKPDDFWKEVEAKKVP